MDQGQIAPEGRLDVGEVGDLYLHHLEHVMRRKPTTIQDYRIILGRHLTPYFGRSALVRITTNQVSGYMTAKLNQGLSPKTINNHLNFLHGVFVFAVKRE
ncbi:MAG: site-specific integrase, partial [Solirubrobacteraceae bacterium]